MKARAILAEDEPELAAELRERLADAWPELEIAAIAADGVKALQALDAHRPDVAFVDIEMPGASGLEFARLAAGRCHVVLVTAYDQHALEAYEHGAVDYLVKPVNPARLHATVRRLQERLGGAPAEPAHSPPESGYLRWINASKGQEIRVITTEEVCYFKAEDKYTLVVTAEGEALVRKPIKDLAARLDPDVFWQVHRSTVVNANAIASVHRDFRGHLVLRLKERPETLAVAESCNHLFRA